MQLLAMLCRQMQILSFAIVIVSLLMYAVLQGCFIWPWLVVSDRVTSFSQISWTWLRTGKDPSLPWVIVLLQVSSNPLSYSLASIYQQTPSPQKASVHFLSCSLHEVLLWQLAY